MPLLLRLALVVLLAAPIAEAQPSERPFETLTVTLAGAATAGTAPYTDFWNPGPGVEARVATPFYLGRFTVGASVAQHEVVEGLVVEGVSGVPDYLALYFFGVWSGEVRLPGGIRLAPGLGAGLFRMQFDTDDAVAVRNEAELAVGPELWLSVPVAARWDLRAGVGGVRVFTAERIDLGFVRLGLARTLDTPGWLETILR